MKTVLREHHGTAEVTGLDGVPTIYGFAPVGGNAGGRLFISAGRTSASVFADPNHDLRRYLLLAGLGLLAALAVSYVMTNVLLGRWSNCTVVELARRFGAGDLTARAPVPRGLGELTDVANALNAAALDIEQRQAAQTRLLSEPWRPRRRRAAGSRRTFTTTRPRRWLPPACAWTRWRRGKHSTIRLSARPC